MLSLRVSLAESSVECDFRGLGAGYSNRVCQLAPLLLGSSKQVAPRLFPLPFSKVRGSRSKTRQLNGKQLFSKVRYLRVKTARRRRCLNRDLNRKSRCR